MTCLAPRRLENDGDIVALLLDVTDDLVLQLDPAPPHAILLASRSAETIFGRPLTGQLPSSLFGDVTARNLTHAIGNDKVQSFVPIRLSLSGTEGPRRLYEFRLAGTTASGGALAMIGEDITILDTTEAELRQASHRFGVALDTVLDGVIRIDHRGVIVAANRAALALFGYPADELLGQNVSILIPEPHRHRHDDYIEQYLRTGQARIIGFGREVEGQRRDGSIFPMELGVGRSDLDDLPSFIGIVRDLSERKAAERKLLNARDRADAAGRAKGHLLTQATHELRTPVNAIVGYTEMGSYRLKMLAAAVRASQGSIPKHHLVADLMEYFDHIHSAGNRLMATVDGMLNLASLDAGTWEMTPTPQDPQPLIQMAATHHADFAGQSNIRLVWPDKCDCQIIADASATVVALRNLIHNGIKFSPAGSQVEIACLCDDPDFVTIQIADRGCGIPADRLKMLGNAFLQADTGLTRRHEGCGLGLAVSRTIAEIQGGRVDLFCRPDGGTIVCLRLPRHRLAMANSA